MKLAMAKVLNKFPTLDVFDEGSVASTVSVPAKPGYESLPNDSIRLLEILPDDAPGNSEIEISCRIVQYAIHHAVPYTALSYTWGAKPDDCEILLNGHRTLIRKNLWRFLRQAKRLKPRPFKWLWIDALCINQSDHQERSQQVRLMPQIYQHAKRVVVWLGPAYDGSEEAMDGLVRYAACRRGKKNVWNITGKASNVTIGLLCRRAYWTRLWIFQEVIFAPEIMLMCGDRTAPWEPLRELLLNAIDHEPPDGVRVSRFEAVTRFQAIHDSAAVSVVSMTQKKPSDISLLDLLIATKSLRCAEPRDRVYALLGMNPKGCTNISPDYDTPLPTLLNAVLTNYHREIERPRDLQTVEAQCRTLDAICTQGNAQDSIFRLKGVQGCLPPRDEDVARYPISRNGSLITLWWASYYGYTTVEDLLIGDEEVNAPNWLARAVDDGNEAAVKLLLTPGRNYNALGGQSYISAALCAASSRGHAVVVELLLRYGVDFRRDGGLGGIYEALIAASSQGHFEVVKLLDRYGTKHWARGVLWGVHEALLAASSQGHVEVVKLLLDEGANINHKGKHGGTALTNASWKGHVEVVQELLARGADLSMINANDGSALGYALWQGHAEVVEMLLRYGAEFVAREGQNGLDDALITVSARGHLEIVKLLLRKGADINKTNPSGGSALISASWEGHIEVVKLLLDNGAYVNLKGPGGETALEAASGNAVVKSLLISKGASPTSQTQKLRLGSWKSRLIGM